MRSMVTALALVGVLSAGCGTDAPVFGSARSIGAALGCVDLEPRSAELVDEVATCHLPRGEATIFTFIDDAQRDRWLRFGERYSNNLVVGSTWVVDPATGSADEIRKALL